LENYIQQFNSHKENYLWKQLLQTFGSFYAP
jgi:hypothetical protein